MTRYSASRGIMYSAPPTDEDEEDAVEAATAAESGEAATADD
ncbi:hypothetical protein SAMN05216388_1011116 [Halorientalis persicus]|jgi:hypothetical protein|uniref:Uncharacterized protein n=1 Tax=Halorientalis persicus TaxID=1367881 RepID=A0A1H8P1E6_9EURY|nr:hypothetical protein [Halorientalis persicus]SEO35433.1 hypothetical protein SAMN05216388_1011116 [Halorientalis persicus]